MEKIFKKKFAPMIWVISFVLLGIGFAFMLVNTGVIHVNIHGASTDASLIYNGEYIDLLSLGQQNTPLEKDNGVRIIKIDTQTGFPAAATMTLLGKRGNEITETKTVRFIYQGLPAMLRFTNNVADGLTYQNVLSDFWDDGDQTYIWETNPDVLRDALADYSSQVSTVLG